MPMAILDIDLHEITQDITGLEHFDSAIALIRFKSHPVGKIWIPVIDGRISGRALHDTAMETCDWSLWERWLNDYLDWDQVNDSNAPLPSATVAICTRDRPEDLKCCLDAFIALPDDGQEYLVIDNCPSTNDTRDLVAQYDNVRYVCEERPGLDVARNRALAEARNDIVAFCDDDAIPDPGWLDALRRNFGNPHVLCVTGLTMPLELETDAQILFEQYSSFARGFQRVTYDSSWCNPNVSGHVGAGVNMALRRNVVNKVGTFDEALDAGTPTQSGGDTEMFARILGAGYNIVYEPAALNWHRHRRTWEELQKVLYGYGVGTYAVWTRRFLIERELGVLSTAWGWFRHDQWPGLIRAFRRRPGSLPPNLLLAELRGCLVGPWAYITACNKIRSNHARK